MRKPAVLQRVRSYFLDRPVPDAVFQLDPGYLSAIRVSRRTRDVEGRFVRALGRGVLQASFDKANVLDPRSFKHAFGEARKGIGLEEGRAALLIPDPSVRVFILAADSLPHSEKERDEFIRWRVGKQMPILHEDLRIDYRIARGSGSGPGRLVVAMARQAVVREYEGIFEGTRIKAGTVTLPAFSLVNLLRGRDASNSLVLNVEQDHLSFLAVMGSEWSLFRQKGVAADGRPSTPLGQRIDQIVKEAENTLHFLEDKDKRKVERLWVRSGPFDEAGELTGNLGARLRIPVAGFDSIVPRDWDIRDKNVFAPLLGQIA